MPKQKPVNKGGRPSNYRAEFPELVYRYVEKCKAEDKLPKIKEFCYENGINPDKIERYTKLNNGFRSAIDHLKFVAESFLLDKGLTRKVDSNFARFILAANYGYVETSKTINEGKNEPVVIRLDMSGGYVPPISSNAPNRLIDKDKQHN